MQNGMSLLMQHHTHTQTHTTIAPKYIDIASYIHRPALIIPLFPFKEYANKERKKKNEF
jgi:hypothetical protein